MEVMVFPAFWFAMLITVLASVAPKTRRMIRFLSLQAGAIGVVELIYRLADLTPGLTVESVVKFLAAFAEWLSCAALIPLLLYMCMRRTENSDSKPVIDTQKIVIAMIIMIILYLVFEVFLVFGLIPLQLNVFPLSMLIFFQSIVIMATQRDALKILVGLNMSINALYPLLTHLPLAYVALELAATIFVNIIAIFVIRKSYAEYGTLLVTGWK
ncbi:MAG: hypothetical protein QMD23_03920 [Candidatus Bathyarchaeia archaeon]|nr:hypothetical protein [Candidatus Bathyarchaeia archaeon]